MSRAEFRRKNKQEQKSKTATYNLTEEQLEDIIHKKINNKIKKVKQQATDDAVNTALTLMLALPIEVLMDYYPKDAATKDISGFTAKVLEYYEKWQDGKLDINKLKKDMWDRAGFKLEEGTR